MIHYITIRPIHRTATPPVDSQQIAPICPLAHLPTRLHIYHQEPRATVGIVPATLYRRQAALHNLSCIYSAPNGKGRRMRRLFSARLLRYGCFCFKRRQRADQFEEEWSGLSTTQGTSSLQGIAARWGGFFLAGNVAGAGDAARSRVQCCSDYSTLAHPPRQVQAG